MQHVRPQPAVRHQINHCKNEEMSVLILSSLLQNEKS